MKKVVRLGIAPTGATRLSVFCEIKFFNGRLSICGVHGPTIHGNATGGCGQIRDAARSVDKFAPGWNRAEVSKFVDVWDRWHLNDLRAGCEHQRADGWDNSRLREACSVCGYKYGTAWLTEDVPAEIVTYLESLPDTDRTPAWV